MDLMYEHFKLDYPELSNSKATDDDFDKAQDEIPAHEHFEDPDFDKAWNGEEEDTEEWEEV